MKQLGAIAAILLAATLSAQAAWVTVSQGTSSDLNAIAFASSEVAVAVGSDGLVLRTLDGGATWQRMPMLEDIDLFDVTVLSTGVWVAVGEKHWGTGAVAISNDSGANWWLPNVSMFSGMSSVCFTSPSTGFATARNSLLRTGDGGVTWTAESIAGTQYVTAVRFVDAMRGTVAGGFHDQVGFTKHTVDGGATWITDPDLYIEPLSAVHHLDAQRAWRVGGDFEYGAFLSSTADGGATWSQMVLPDLKLSLNDIVFTDAQHGFAVGGTALLETMDGGAHWTQTKLLESGYTTRLAISPRGDVWAVGSGGRIMKQTQSATGVSSGMAAPSVSLLANYPNPVAASTELRFTLAERTRATLAVYAMNGNNVGTVVDGIMDAGDHTASWQPLDASGARLAAGTYLVKLTAGETTVSQRVTVVR